ncbi:hypothetical protein DNTS_025214 [Danionella cerebrum]|uniref:Uncharacterized protein n=1 Tax=Danionella cerebrum TaxID=2873325 RepID=A0A553Q4F0_9TELE|nr:hypothetical protein DNTS_025214 [Danionella translucida]
MHPPSSRVWLQEDNNNMFDENKNHIIIVGCGPPHPHPPLSLCSSATALPLGEGEIRVLKSSSEQRSQSPACRQLARTSDGPLAPEKRDALCRGGQFECLRTERNVEPLRDTRRWNLINPVFARTRSPVRRSVGGGWSVSAWLSMRAVPQSPAAARQQDEIADPAFSSRGTCGVSAVRQS